MNKYLKTIIIVLTTIIALFVVIGIIINYFFQDQVIQVVIANINKQVDSKIEVQSAHFSVFRKFPNASVEFRNVSMSPAKNFDTLGFKPQYNKQLLSAERVFAELNLFSILRKDFHITKIDIHDGKIIMLTDKDGRHNFLFWKTPAADASTSSPIELQNVTLHNVDLYYQHLQSNTIIDIHAEKARLTGRFVSQQYSLGVDLDGTIQHLSVDNNLFVKGRSVELSGKLSVDSNKYVIKKCNVELEKVPMKVAGMFTINNMVDLDLHVEGKNLDYASFVTLLPEQYGKLLRDYPGKGIFNFNVDVTGMAGRKTNPHIDAKFGIGKGVITHQPTKIKLSDLSFEGSFTTGSKNIASTSLLNITQFACNMGGGSMKGSLSVQNFQKPLVKIQTSGNVDMGQLYRFIPVKQINQMGGIATGNLSVTARLKGLPLKKTSDIDQLEINGKLNLENASLKLNDRPYRFSRINGALDFNKEITAEQLSFILNSNDFLVNGQIERVIPYLLGNSKTLYLNADVISNSLCADSLLVSGKTNTTAESSNEGSALMLPENVIFDVNLSAGVFRYRNFEATELKATLAYRPRIIAVKSVLFNTMSGTLSGNGTIANDAGNSLWIIGETTLKQIDIRQMFRTFGNFSQNVIRSEHLKGALSGSLTFAAAWDEKMRMREDDIEVESDLTLAGGELINFEPMQNLSRFVALEELQNIKFSTLHTKVYVKNRQITMPKTDIASSAFNISGSGVHYFDNSYTYHIKILLSELLAAKARKAKTENSDNEYIEDNKRTSIYLKVVGKGEDFKINYDKQSAKESIATDIRQEKQTLKGILKEEFGWFKKDTLVHPVTPSSNQSGKLRFSFDEDQENTSGKKTKAKKPKEQEDKITIEGWE